MAVAFNSPFNVAERNEGYNNIALTIKGGYNCFYRLQSFVSCVRKLFVTKNKKTGSRDITKLWIS